MMNRDICPINECHLHFWCLIGICSYGFIPQFPCFVAMYWLPSPPPLPLPSDIFQCPSAAPSPQGLSEGPVIQTSSTCPITQQPPSPSPSAIKPTQPSSLLPFSMGKKGLESGINISSSSLLWSVSGIQTELC
ncbi:uncharacterized protein BDZ99DRAFT_253344 [Mytilinidion resinicola]|uniref:Uncharacterized protein n=1 Tax=Mytilinidion resinicola TaxID=574789 RepID=A0A6A6YX03_9PEZI|nr:uncharacterized protein BDZ99DRAFT_253344 [Mytilinidion resinicola]KAF2813300.1 hypothetical protein BDZ99DRAFT_253344 [Mytilinidion resinicola]